jgi:hypothetical protein
MSQPPIPLDLTDPAHLVRRFVRFCWRLAMGMSPAEAGRFGRLGVRCRRFFLADASLEPMVEGLRTGEEQAPEVARPRLMALARRLFEEARTRHPETTAHFETLCAARGREPEATVVAAVERAAQRPFRLPGTAPAPGPRQHPGPRRRRRPRPIRTASTTGACSASSACVWPSAMSAP